MDMIGIVGLIIGVVSFAASIVFFVLGNRAERTSRAILDKINDAIQSWQTQIMSSNIELLNSRVEIVGKQVALEDAKAKHTFIAELSERIKFLVERANPDNFGPPQSHLLGQLLGTFEAVSKSSLPPELVSRIVSDHLGASGPKK